MAAMPEAVPAIGIVQDAPGRAVPGAVQGAQLLGGCWSGQGGGARDHNWSPSGTWTSPAGPGDRFPVAVGIGSAGME